ncbi:hypothetical protein SAMN05216371_2187 [Streptomyces sp. TLI_053]|uniref:hypothetical protein n=1 Tax=Streptomyces sp. TLI_053 TaxID=1855352 RepID=UPI00087CC66D|nr:hypothetical protein [Streptomyces sp. TLI_053]SDT40756.1 hypothetical protein SAMN05216371_2187 [Streptomyces sp. TLI_053]
MYRHRGAGLLHLQAEQDGERLVASMPLPDPFDLDRLVGNLAEASGRHIVLRPIPASQLTGLDGTCGLLVKHDTRPVDLILHREGRSLSHEVELKVHQLVHLWAGDGAGLVGPPDVLRARGMAPVGGIPATARSLKRDAFIELRADHAARLISRRREHGAASGAEHRAPPGADRRPAAGTDRLASSGADRRTASGAGAEPLGREARQPAAERLTPGVRSRPVPRSPPSSR